MKILAFDTTNNTASVAISVDDEIVYYEENLINSQQAEKLFPLIEGALNGAKMKYKDIDYLGVTSGPGSFTGIRIGLSAAKGILLATNIKGVAVSNFDIAYFRARRQVKTFDKICILLNAYRGQLYARTYEANAGATSPVLIDISSVRDYIKSNYNKDDIFCVSGNGIDIAYTEISNITDLVILPRFSRIKAAHICYYIAQNKDIKLAATSIEPLYIRMPDAKKPATNLLLRK